jgi:hypothetical protein
MTPSDDVRRVSIGQWSAMCRRLFYIDEYRRHRSLTIEFSRMLVRSSNQLSTEHETDPAHVISCSTDSLSMYKRFDDDMSRKVVHELHNR